MMYFVALCEAIARPEWIAKDKKALEDWKRLVNMSPKQLKEFLDSPEGKGAGLSRDKARAAGVRRGRDSGFAILRMKEKAVEEWTAADRAWMHRQVSFIKRMLGMQGALYDSKGRPTRKLLALKVWGHDPEL